ncbi:MAG: tRNA nucleotidyltransferase [Desulfohalobiaceae bacterium]
MQIYQFGGAVRDSLLGHEPKDLDYLVLDCQEEEFLHNHPGARKVGQAPYQVYLYQGAQYSLSNNRNIYNELARKDLSINSLARDSNQRLICTDQAWQDLQQKLLRPVSKENFLQDPVRVFRAARLSAKLPDFRIHPELLEAMQQVSSSGLLAGAAAERLGQEIQLACSSPRPGNFLRLLAKTGNLQPWLPELDQAQWIPAGPSQGNTSLLQRLAMLMDSATESPLLVWLAMTHDLGKTRTDPAYWPRHYLHDFLGPRVIRDLVQRLRLSQKWSRAGELAAAWHLAACSYQSFPQGRKVDMLLLLHNQGLLKEFTKLLQLIGCPRLCELAARDLNQILQVRLPRKYRNLGPLSGAVLRRLRIQALQAQDA